MVLKKFISILMLILLVSHGVIQFTLFEFFQLKYKSDTVEKITSGIPSSELEIIAIKKSDIENHTVNLSWKNNAEFRYKDFMYDVVKIETTEDSILFYCIRDDNESSLFSILDKMLGSIFETTEDDSDELSGLNVFLSHYYSGSDYSGNNNYSLEKNFDYKFLCKILEGIKQINTPPPNYSC